MQPMPEIPDGELDSDLDFIKQITIFATIVVLGVTGFFTYMIFTGDITFFGPSDLILEKERDFDELVNYEGYAGDNGELRALYEFVKKYNVKFEWIGMNGKMGIRGDKFEQVALKIVSIEFDNIH
mgnify:CR=1 FL=1